MKIDKESIKKLLHDENRTCKELLFIYIPFVLLLVLSFNGYIVRFIAFLTEHILRIWY